MIVRNYLTPAPKEPLQLMMLASESLLEIIYCLSPSDASRYASTSKLARALVSDQRLWLSYGSKLLANVQSPSRSERYVEEAMLSLCFPDPRSLYLCMHRAKTSLIGWYLISPSNVQSNTPGNHNQSCGGLVCLRLNALRGYSQKIITLEVIEASGECISSMKIRYSHSHRRLVCYLHENDEGLFSIEFDKRGDIELRPLYQIADNVTNCDSYFLQSLPPKFQPIKKKDVDHSLYRTNVLGNVERITGLFVAPFGSHGLELLHISLVENEGRISEESTDVSVDEPYYVIDGLKVTGDPNVPAAQLSFTVDVTNSYEFQSWISSDRRPIIFFSNNGVVDATLMSERQTNIRAAYRGKGQINRLSHVWDPEWVNLTLVIYQDPSVSNGATFSIVWDDIGEAYRHLMDFLPFSGRQYPTIDPPLRWSSTNFDDFTVRHAYELEGLDAMNYI
jgi:Cyclin D1 binding domain